jgi:hypothetical protein
MHLAWLYVLWIAFCKREMGWFFTLRIFVSDVAIAFMHVRLVHLNIHKPVILEAAVRWISAHFARVVLKKTTLQQNTKSMDGIGLQKGSCLFVLKCVQLKPSSLETVTRSQTFIVSVSLLVDLALVLGVGERLTKQRLVQDAKD